MFNCTVPNVTLSPKSSMATPGRTRSSRGHRTLSTRLPMVSMSRASESLVGAWANSCRVRGRLSLLMMARPKSSNACSIGSISREQVGHGIPAPAHMLQEIISLQQPHMGKRSRLAAECCFHKFFLGVKGRGFPECRSSYMKALTFPSGATKDVIPPLRIPTHTTTEPPSHRAGSWIQ